MIFVLLRLSFTLVLAGIVCTGAVWTTVAGALSVVVVDDSVVVVEAGAIAGEAGVAGVAGVTVVCRVVVVLLLLWALAE